MRPTSARSRRPITVVVSIASMSWRASAGSSTGVLPRRPGPSGLPNEAWGSCCVKQYASQHNANIASRISERLTNADIRLLVDALSDTDKTVRLQTTELLYVLNDKRVVDDSLNAIRNNNNENLVIVLSLDGSERLRVRIKL